MTWVLIIAMKTPTAQTHLGHSIAPVKLGTEVMEWMSAKVRVMGVSINLTIVLNSCWVTTTDIDECEENTDGCQGRCMNTEGSFNCFCDTDEFGIGYVPVGLFCVGESHFQSICSSSIILCSS